MKVYQATGIDPQNKKLQKSAKVHTDCLIGIEIELESFDLMDLAEKRHDLKSFNKYWSVIPDHSLRDNGQEFVLTAPKSGAGVSTALKAFDVLIGRLDQKPQAPQTTSTHVHLDVSNMEVHDLVKFLFTYRLFEESLLRYCGEHRQSNLYCLTFKEASKPFMSLASALRDPTNLRMYDTRNFKYGACNLSSLNSYGSVEFRCKGGSTSGAEIIEWVNMLTAIKMFAATVKSYDDLLMLASQEVTDIAKLVFKEKAEVIAEHIQPEDIWDAVNDIQCVLAEAGI